MDVILLLARLLPPQSSSWPAWPSFADRAGSRRAVTDFGVPTALAPALGILLPLAELAVAVALIPASSAWWGADGALVLLLLFVVGIAANLARGRKPECRCFGQLHSEPAGWKTLVRNGVLAVVAGFVVWEGYRGADPARWLRLAGLSAAQVVGLVFGLALLVVLAAQWSLLLNLLRQYGRLLVRVDALERERGAGGAAPSPTAWRPNRQLGSRSGHGSRSLNSPAFTGRRAR